MAKYPTKEVRQGGDVNPKSGGSITVIKNEPDFGKFTDDDWKTYNLEKLHKENAKLRGWLSLLIGSLVFAAIYYFSDMWRGI